MKYRRREKGEGDKGTKGTKGNLTFQIPTTEMSK
jgi:hypothetical protein